MSPPAKLRKFKKLKIVALSLTVFVVVVWGYRRIFRTLDSRIAEPSGVVESRRHPDVLWMHSDSGGENAVYAVTPEGKLISTHELIGQVNEDWEDIAIDDSGHLYVADFGNNYSERRDLRIHQLMEPDPFSGDSALEVERTISFRYADQIDFESSLRNFDAESLIWSNGKLLIFSKHREDKATTIYGVDLKKAFGVEEGQELVLEPLGQRELGGPAVVGGMATAADLHQNGHTIALLTYHALFFYELDSKGRVSDKEIHRIDFTRSKTRQCEAVAWEGDDILIVNEGGDMLRLEDPLKWSGPFPS